MRFQGWFLHVNSARNGNLSRQWEARGLKSLLDQRSTFMDEKEEVVIESGEVVEEEIPKPAANLPQECVSISKGSKLGVCFPTG